MGASVRASLALEGASRAWALLHGRSYVVPEDVERLFLPVVARLVFVGGFLARTRRGRVRRARGAPARASSSRRARARRTTRSSAVRVCCRASSSRDVPARPARQADRPLVRNDAELPPRHRLRRRRLAAVPPRRRRALHRLGRVGPALRCAAERRVHRARALRGRGATRRDRLRPAASSCYPAPLPWLDKPRAPRRSPSS